MRLCSRGRSPKTARLGFNGRDSWQAEAASDFKIRSRRDHRAE